MLHRLSLLLLLLCRTIVAPATLVVFDMKAWGIQRDPVGNGDGYVKVYLNNQRIGTTQVKNNTRNPVWVEIFLYERALYCNILKLKVYDKGVRHDERLGNCETRIRFGTHKNTCNLRRGAKLEYSYILQIRGNAAGH